MSDELEQVETLEPSDISTSSEEPTNVDTSITDEPKTQESTSKEQEKDQEPGKPEWLNPKYKTVEDQAKAYHESEKKMHETNARLNELERQTKEKEINSYKELADNTDKNINTLYDTEKARLDYAKEQLIKNYTEQLESAGYSGQLLSTQIASYNKQLDKEYYTHLSQLEQLRSSEIQKAQSSRQQYVNLESEKQFKLVENDLKEKLQLAEYNHLFTKFKSKYKHANDFKDFLPIIEEAMELRDKRLAETKQINQQKQKIANSQKSGNGTFLDIKHGKSKMQQLKNDPVAFAKWLNE
jgi:hypothetical protein